MPEGFEHDGASSSLETDERFSLLVNAVSDYAVFMLDPDGRVASWNQGAERINGYSAQEIVGRHFSVFFTEDAIARGQPQRELEAALAEGRFEDEGMRVRKDGSRFFAHVIITAVYDESGRLRGFAKVTRDVTERRDREEALAESERRFREVIETMNEAFVLRTYDPPETLYASPSIAEVFGISVEALYADPLALRSLIHPDDRSSVIAQADAISGPRDFEYRILRPDGQLRWIRSRVAPVIGAGGQVTRMAATYDDVTDKRETQDALRQSQAQLGAFIDSLPASVILTDRQDRVLIANGTARALFGRSTADLVGLPFGALDAPGQIDRESIRKLDEGGAARPTEVDVIDAAGEARTLLAWRFTATVDGASVGQGRVGIDITELKRAQQALAASEERFRLLAENSSDIIVRCSAVDGRVLYASQACQQLLGCDAEEMIGTLFLDLVHPDDRDGADARSPRRGDRSKFLALELRLRRSDGSYVWTDVGVRRVFDPATGEVTESQLAIRDISERRELLAELAQARDDAELANRAKSEFLSRMSHELRTPLNAILGFSQLLELDELSVVQREGVEHITKGGRRLLDLINEVLDLARIETGQLNVSPEPVRVVETLEEAIQLMRPLAAGREIRLEREWDAPIDRQHIVADRQRLGQVLLNLISNAVKYNVDHGTVTVSCELAGDELVRIGVADTGPGVAAEKLPLLFAPFERLGAEQTEIEGTGLGLALSKSLIEAMGGQLLVETVVGTGSKFWIELPATAEPSPELRPTDDSGVDGSHVDSAVAGTLLYIEDNLSNLRLIEAVLARRPNVELISAMTAGIGIELARSRHPDLILLDLHLPDESGESVLRRLRTESDTAALPIVIASADATPGKARRLIAAGASDYLTKPIDVGALLAIIDRLIGRRAA